MEHGFPLTDVAALSLPVSAMAIIALSVVATSFLSGIFGMAGGIILLGVLLAYLDVAPAMVVFGATQIASNGWRAVLWCRFALWGIVVRYAIGSLVAYGVLKLFPVLPGKTMIYLGLGLMPLLVEALPKRLAPNITRAGVPYLCGALIMVLQLFAGAAGHVLDQFFNKTTLDRRVIVATKAVTQVIAHMLRIAYFGAFAGAASARVPLFAQAGFVLLAIIGTTLAAQVLKKLSDHNYKRWSRLIVIAVALFYVAKGVGDVLGLT